MKLWPLLRRTSSSRSQRVRCPEKHRPPEAEAGVSLFGFRNSGFLGFRDFGPRDSSRVGCLRTLGFGELLLMRDRSLDVRRTTSLRFPKARDGWGPKHLRTNP